MPAQRPGAAGRLKISRVLWAAIRTFSLGFPFVASAMACEVPFISRLFHSVRARAASSCAAVLPPRAGWWMPLRRNGDGVAPERRWRCAGTVMALRRNGDAVAPERSPRCAGTVTPLRRNGDPVAPERPCEAARRRRSRRCRTWRIPLPFHKERGGDGRLEGGGGMGSARHPPGVALAHPFPRFHNRTFSFFAFALLPSERPVRGVSRQDPLIFDLGGLFSPQGMV